MRYPMTVLLLMLAIVLNAACAAEITIYNKTADTLKLGIQPKSGGWDAKNAYSPDELLVLENRPEDMKAVEIAPGQRIVLNCGWCEQFKVKEQGRYWVGPPGDWDAGFNYLIEGKSPEYIVHKEPLQWPKLAVATMGMSLSTFTLVKAAKDDSTEILLSKSKGYWLSLDSNRDSVSRSTFLKITLKKRESAQIVCGDCGQVRMKEVNGAAVDYALDDEQVYTVSADGRIVNAERIPPAPPPAPPSASGQMYLVNGWKNPVRFVFYRSDLAVADGSVKTLDGGKGEQLYCGQQCVVLIRTGSRTLKRLLSPGGSYIIGLDKETKLLDISDYGGTQP